MISPDSEAHWRDSARTPRFYFIDSLAAFPLLIFLLHIRLWTFILALAVIGFLMILERFKFTLPVFFRWMRATLAGPLRIAKPWWRE
jgi:intracellular multiplication protein IcmT